MALQLVSISGRCGYLPGANNVGVVRLEDGKSCLLIDSGQHADHAKQIAKACASEGLEIRAVINTHAHADHFGGSNLLAERTPAVFYAPPLDEAIMRHPILEPGYLFNGAAPLDQLRDKWLLAKPARTDEVLAEGELRIGGVNVSIACMPGHSAGQVVVGVDDVLFCADAIFGQDVLARHRVPYVSDLGQQEESMRRLADMPYGCFLPAHGELTRDIRLLRDENLTAVQRAKAAVLQAAETPAGTDELVRRVSRSLGLDLPSVPRYYLFQSLLLAYLSHLQGSGEIEVAVQGNRLRWRRK